MRTTAVAPQDHRFPEYHNQTGFRCLWYQKLETSAWVWGRRGACEQSWEVGPVAFILLPPIACSNQNQPHLVLSRLLKPQNQRHWTVPSFLGSRNHWFAANTVRGQQTPDGPSGPGVGAKSPFCHFLREVPLIILGVVGTLPGLGIGREGGLP